LFLSVALDPWNLLLTIAVAGFFYLSIGESNSLASTLLFVLITIASAILGGRVTKQWVDVTEGGIVIARGRAAVRSLKLLLRYVAALEGRIRKFRASEQEIEKHPEVTKRNYDEAIEICSLLQEQTVNSIENWTDIVPEADIKTEIGVISELKNFLNDKDSDLKLLKQQLEEAKGKSEQERNQLRQQIKEIEKQKNSLEREIRDRKVGLGGLGLIGGLESIAGSINIENLTAGRSGLISSVLKTTDVTPGSNLVIGTKQKSDDAKK
jgi:hypothetical protein